MRQPPFYIIIMRYEVLHSSIRFALHHSFNVAGNLGASFPNWTAYRPNIAVGHRGCLVSQKVAKDVRSQGQSKDAEEVRELWIHLETHFEMLSRFEGDVK